MIEKALCKRQIFAECAYHARPLKPLDRRLTHGAGGCREGLSLQASFAEKAASVQNADDRLLAEFRNSGEPDPALLNVKDSIPHIPLRINHLAWTAFGNRNSITERGQNLAIERQWAAPFHFLHHHIVVLHHQSAKRRELFGSQS